MLKRALKPVVSGLFSRNRIFEFLKLVQSDSISNKFYQQQIFGFSRETISGFRILENCKTLRYIFDQKPGSWRRLISISQTKMSQRLSRNSFRVFEYFFRNRRTQCCGNYPFRFPFPSDRGCCDGQTFNSQIFECCDGEIEILRGFKTAGQITLTCRFPTV